MRPMPVNLSYVPPVAGGDMRQPSYTPPPPAGYAPPPVVLQQQPSYAPPVVASFVPPPQRMPSYVPAVQAVPMPAPGSYVPPQAVMLPPQQAQVPVHPGSYVPPPMAAVPLQQAPPPGSYVPPPMAAVPLQQAPLQQASYVPPPMAASFVSEPQASYTPLPEVFPNGQPMLLVRHDTPRVMPVAHPAAPPQQQNPHGVRCKMADGSDLNLPPIGMNLPPLFRPQMCALPNFRSTFQGGTGPAASPPGTTGMPQPPPMPRMPGPLDSMMDGGTALSLSV